MGRVGMIIICLCVACLGTLRAEAYISLSPLDTAALPVAKPTKCEMCFLQNMLESKAFWRVLQHRLERNNYSDKCIADLQDMLGNMLKHKVLQLPCSYTSIQPDGDTLCMSGSVILPRNRQLQGVILASHYTVGSNREAPSASTPFESIFVTKGYAVVMADYLGFGATVDSVHPYLYWQSAAQAQTDLLQSVQQLLDYYGYTFPKEVISYGYSEGGAVALGTAKHIEKQLPDWQLTALYAGAGPYDVAATYDACVEADSVGIPCAIPMLIMGMSAAYNLHLRKADFFREPLLSHYEQWVESKQYTVNEINTLMTTHRLSEAMTPEGRDKTQPETARFYAAMQQSAILGYAPSCPTFLFHSTTDDIVPFLNSEHLTRSLSASDTIAIPKSTSTPNTPSVSSTSSVSSTPSTPSTPGLPPHIVFDFADYGSHMAACILFLQRTYTALP